MLHKRETIYGSVERAIVINQQSIICAKKSNSAYTLKVSIEHECKGRVQFFDFSNNSTKHAITSSELEEHCE